MTNSVRGIDGVGLISPEQKGYGFFSHVDGL
jgi:hypothetical protein